MQYHTFPLRQEGFLDRGLHKIKYWVYGNLKGTPIVSFHGGPASSSKPSHLAPFNPRKYMLIQFDQRGAGESLPIGEVKENNLDLILSDVEALREKLKIEKWIIFGYSWGSTVALAYLAQYSQRVIGAIVGGIFLGQFSLFENASKDKLPISLATFKNELKSFIEVNKSERDLTLDLAEKFSTNGLAKQAKISWAMGARNSALALSQDVIAPESSNYLEEVTVRDLLKLNIVFNYAVKNNFFNWQEISKKLKDLIVPMLIFHGDDDLMCDVSNADSLAVAYPKATYNKIKGMPHAIKEKKFIDETSELIQTWLRELRH